MKKKLKALFTVAIASVLMLTACNSNATPGNPGSNTNPSAESWLEAPSLKEAYVDSGIFDRFGFACETGEITNADTAKGLVRHGNTTTPGNQFKPQFVLWEYSQPAHTATFTDSAGTTINVPNKINFATNMDPYLNAAKKAGIQLRGHVLVWHSQTFEWFFTKDYAYKVTYSNGKPNNLVDKETMTARQEWYIKSVLEHVAEWEAANGYGEGNHIIYSWDVVNEAVADDARDKDSAFLRGSTPGTQNAKDSGYGCTDGGGSRWYQIYGSGEFIVNAFRFANAYAPSDVTLCYNDYNEYMDYAGEDGAGAWKTKGIIRLIKLIQKGEAKTINGKSVKPRIDAVGLQSHVGASWPGVSGYESALKRYLALGIDVQVTEFDLGTTTKDDTSNWSSYFKMLRKYGKNGSEASKYDGHCITGVTIWGINDENSWISNGGKQFPLLFKKSGSTYDTKGCFYSVLEAAN